MRENGPLLSRVVDPPGTKGGPRAGNFPGPPKNTFCPGWSHDPGQKNPPFVPGEATTRDKRVFLKNIMRIINPCRDSDYDSILPQV